MRRSGFILIVGWLTAVVNLLAQTPAPATRGQADLNTQLAASKAGTSVEAIRNFVRCYEPNELGLTKDKSDELFMDFKFSLMFPLIGDFVDRPLKSGSGETPGWRVGPFDSQHTALLLTATIRGGQYIWSRPSAPVVEKRFNPQLLARLWFVEQPDLQRYVDVIYGHESNGQAITTLELFNEQAEVFRKLEKHPGTEEARTHARRSARDAISRGADYVGAELSWFWPSEKTAKDVAISGVGRVKVRHFLDYGILQRGKEEYNEWEGDGRRHAREDYDGLMFQYTGVLKPLTEHLRWLTGRYTVTYTTGLAQPFQHSTWELDLGATIRRLPLSFWYRRGYNSDLIDYYKENQSYGGRISIWEF